MSDLTPERVAEGRALLEKMTPGPWNVDVPTCLPNTPPESIRPGIEAPDQTIVIWGDKPDENDDGGIRGNDANADAHGIVWLVNNASALLAAVEERDRLRGEKKFLEDKGIRVGTMKTSDKADPYLAYVIRSGSELDDSPAVMREIEAEQRIASLTAQVEKMREVAAWRAIETAPKDGTLFLAVKGGVYQVCRFLERTVVSGGKSYTEMRLCVFPQDISWNPTHWMPLPPAPTSTGATTDAR